MMSRIMRRFLLAFLAVTLVPAGVALRGQQPSKPKGAEWPTYGGDLASTRYSPLDQITKDNFKTLEVAWRFKSDALGPRPEFNFQATPLMVNGVVYTVAGTRRAVVALDAATGEMLWMHSENEGKRGEAAPRQLSGRGLSYWPGSGGDGPRVVYVTPGYQMIALDAKTGQLASGFGRKGIVDLKEEDDQPIDLEKGEMGLHATPIIAKANRMLAGKFDLLGLRDLSFGDPIDWHLEPMSGKRAPRAHWSRLNYLDPAIIGDKKIVWELNRQQHFATLGQAFWLTGDERYAQAFVAQHLQTYVDYPPRQKPGSFSLDQVLSKLQEGARQ